MAIRVLPFFFWEIFCWIASDFISTDSCQFSSLAFFIFITLMLLAAVGGSNQPVLCSKSGNMQHSPAEQKMLTTTCRTLHHHLHQLCRPPTHRFMSASVVRRRFCCSTHFSAISRRLCCVSGSLGSVVCQSRVFMLLTWPVWVTFFQPINFTNPWRGSLYWGH